MQDPRIDGEKDIEKTGSRLLLRSAMLLVLMLFFAGISINQNARTNPISISVFPENPKDGMPFLINFKLNNPATSRDVVKYTLYANGGVLTKGEVILPGSSSKQFTYIYPDSPGLGEKVTLHLKTSSTTGEFEKTLSMPAYPPQVWSSFVSFASFSTSLLGSASMGSSMGSAITTMQYYKGSFMDDDGLNIGLLFSLVLITLLVFLELTEPIDFHGIKINGLRLRLGRLSAILFIVFLAMVFTKVVMIVG